MNQPTKKLIRVSGGEVTDPARYAAANASAERLLSELIRESREDDRVDFGRVIYILLGMLSGLHAVSAPEARAAIEQRLRETLMEMYTAPPAEGP